jgi:hypothetical protein
VLAYCTELFTDESRKEGLHSVIHEMNYIGRKLFGRENLCGGGVRSTKVRHKTLRRYHWPNKFGASCFRSDMVSLLGMEYVTFMIQVVMNEIVTDCSCASQKDIEACDP